MKSFFVLLALLGVTTWKPPSGIRAIIGNHAGDNAGYLMATGTDFYLVFAYEYKSPPACIAEDLSPPFRRSPLCQYPWTCDDPTKRWWHVLGVLPGDIIVWHCLQR